MPNQRSLDLPRLDPGLASAEDRTKLIAFLQSPTPD
jgi:hypothetical protein